MARDATSCASNSSTNAISSSKRTVPARVKAKPKGDGLAPLVAEVRALIQAARRGAASVVNTLQVMTNFEIGRRIVEHEQRGEKRAAYGAELLIELSTRLTEEGLKNSNCKIIPGNSVLIALTMTAAFFLIASCSPVYPFAAR